MGEFGCILNGQLLICSRVDFRTNKPFIKYFRTGCGQEVSIRIIQINIGKEKLRQLMTSWRLWHPKSRKKGQVHQWRERKHHKGEMLQMDGSDHAWLEDRGPRLVLMGYIDDATNDIYGRFYKYEGTFLRHGQL